MLNPWTLIKFFDQKKCQLNDINPAIFGAIVLAAGAFLRMRLVDLKSNFRLKHKQRDSWEPIWADSVAGSCSFLRYRQTRLNTVVWGFAVLFIIIELFCNTPNQIIEWVLDMPFMILIGMCVPIILVSLDSIASTPLNEDIGRYFPEWQEKQLSGFKAGVGIIVITSLAVFFYSIIVLHRATGSVSRAWIQIAIALFVFVFAVRAAIIIHREVKRINKLKLPRHPREYQERMNVAELSLFGISKPVTEFLVGLLVPISTLAGFFRA